MKKTLKTLLVTLMVVILSAGCVKQSTKMSVNDDKSVNLELIYAMNMDALGDLGEGSESSEEGIRTEDYEHLEELGYKIEEYIETADDGSKYTGVKLTVTYNNIDDITADSKDKGNLISAFNEDDDEALKNIKFFYKDGDKYVSNFYIDYTEGEEEADQSMGDYSSMMDMKYEITLPSKAESNNATKVSDTTYTWDLTYGKKNDIDFSFKLDSSNKKEDKETKDKKNDDEESTDNSYVMYMIIGAATVLIVAIIVITIVLAKKKKSNINL